MATLAAPFGKTLDTYVDEALDSNEDLAVWTNAAKILAPQSAVMTNDPFGRLFGSEFGRRAVSSVRNESQTLGVVGTFAANVMGSIVVERIGLPVKESRVLVVSHGKDRLRRSLLILDPSRKAHEAARVAPAAYIEHLIQSAPEFLRNVHWEEPYGVEPLSIHPTTADDALQALWIARPRVVIAPMPELIDTCVGNPPSSVRCGTKSSTAGAVARDTHGNIGFTVCFHATGKAGTAVQIDGNPANVSLDSQVLDTCFVPVPKAQIPSHLKAQRGLLEKRAPGNAEHHTFWSATANAAKRARIVATDWGVPQPTQGRQLCVYTDAVTDYGDSGGALVNNDDQLVGFAFQRTPFGSEMEFSTWIWARSAFNELGLAPV